MEGRRDDAHTDIIRTRRWRRPVGDLRPAGHDGYPSRPQAVVKRDLGPPPGEPVTRRDTYSDGRLGLLVYEALSEGLGILLRRRQVFIELVFVSYWIFD